MIKLIELNFFLFSDYLNFMDTCHQEKTFLLLSDTHNIFLFSVSFICSLQLLF